MKTPSHSTPTYVALRIRQIFKKQGWPLQKKSGRYYPFGGTQTFTEGFSVHKVGCSKSVNIYYGASYSDGRSVDVPLEKKFAKEAEARELLKSLGYRLNHIGWIECDNYDECDG